MAEAPFPSDTRAKGWRFELDHERIRQSDTWALCPADMRPWLLMLWMVAWEQTPCGSMPEDDALICARIGMTSKAFAKAKPALMRGWWKADDGRLYHKVITERVLEMLETRRKETERKRGNRGKTGDKQASPTTVPRDTAVTDDTGTRTSTGTFNSVPNGTGGGAAMSPEEIIFTYGVPLLVNAGSSEKHARSFLGGLRKGRDDAQVVDALRECIRHKAMQPLEYLAKALPPMGKGGSGRPNAQEALEAQNRAVAARFVENTNEAQ